MRQASGLACVMLTALAACKASDSKVGNSIAPPVVPEARLVSWTPATSERTLCGWTTIAVTASGSPSRDYMCAVVSHAWAALDTTPSFRGLAVTDTTGRPTHAQVGVSRMMTSDIPAEMRNVTWIIVFPSTHGDSAGISVQVDSASGHTLVYRHVVP